MTACTERPRTERPRTERPRTERPRTEWHSGELRAQAGAEGQKGIPEVGSE